MWWSIPHPCSRYVCSSGCSLHWPHGIFHWNVSSKRIRTGTMGIQKVLCSFFFLLPTRYFFLPTPRVSMPCFHEDTHFKIQYTISYSILFDFNSIFHSILKCMQEFRLLNFGRTFLETGSPSSIHFRPSLAGWSVCKTSRATIEDDGLWHVRIFLESNPSIISKLGKERKSIRYQRDRLHCTIWNVCHG